MADQRFKIEDGLLVTGANNVVITDLTIGGNTTVAGNLLLVQGNFTVQGTTTYTGSTYYDTDLIPLSNNQRKLGAAGNTFIAYLGDVTVYNSLMPSSNGMAFGNATARWAAYTTTIDATGAVSALGNFTVNATALSVDAGNLRVGINSIPYTNSSLTVVGNTTVNGSIQTINSGNLTIAGNITATGNLSVNGVISTTNTAVVFGKGGIYSNNVTVSNTSANIIDSFPTALSRSAKVFITVDNSTGTPALMHAVDMHVLHDNNGNVLVSKFGEVYNTKLGTFDASITGANVNITFTATSANTYTVKTIRQLALV